MNVALAEVEADHGAGVVDELEQDRRLAAGARAAPDLPGEAVALRSATRSLTWSGSGRSGGRRRRG